VGSTPNFTKALLEHSTGSNEQFEIITICTLLKATTADATKLSQEITPLKNWDEKTDHLFATLSVMRDRTHYYETILFPSWFT
jgi:hypothetical protein